MYRRSFICAFFATLISGCAERNQNSPITDSPVTDTPNITPKPPQLTSIQFDQVLDPRGLNPITYTIRFDNLNPEAEYRVRISIESDAGDNQKIVDVSQQYQAIPGGTGGKIDPPEGTSTDGEIVLYNVSLIENGIVIDYETGGFSYEF